MNFFMKGARRAPFIKKFIPMIKQCPHFFLCTILVSLASIGARPSSALEIQPGFLLAHEDSHHTELGDRPTADNLSHDEHEHGGLEIPANLPIPTVNLIVHPDARQGWNLEVQISNFTFAPNLVNQANIPSAGHAHLYIDGVKITRLYGSWYYLDSLAPGTHDITVSLNSNGHETLMHNGQPIAATVRVRVEE